MPDMGDGLGVAERLLELVLALPVAGSSRSAWCSPRSWTPWSRTTAPASSLAAARVREGDCRSTRDRHRDARIAA